MKKAYRIAGLTTAVAVTTLLSAPSKAVTGLHVLSATVESTLAGPPGALSHQITIQLHMAANVDIAVAGTSGCGGRTRKNARAPRGGACRAR
jgi:hypothetical protein